MTGLSDFIKVYDSVVPKELCDSAIEVFNNNRQHHTEVNNSKRPKFTEMNFTKSLDVLGYSAGEIHHTVLNCFRAVKNEYIQSVLSKAYDGTSFLPEKYGWEQFRIKRYKSKTDEFREHVDIGDSHSSKRYIALLLYLNDNFDGGETEFTTCGLTITPTTGRVLVFPPTWNFPHQGNKVKNGEKYILSTYLNYL